MFENPSIINYEVTINSEEKLMAFRIDSDKKEVDTSSLYKPAISVSTSTMMG